MKKYLLNNLIIAAFVSLATITSCMKEFTVTFCLDVNYQCSVSEYSINRGGKAFLQEPPNPVRDCYEFLGWFNGDTKWDFDTGINSGLVLVARWKEVCCGVASELISGNGKQRSMVININLDYKGEIIN